MPPALEKEIGDDAELANNTQGHQAAVSDTPPVEKSLDNDLDTQDSCETRVGSNLAPETVPNGSATQEKVARNGRPQEPQKLEDQKSKGVIALIMSALCVSLLRLGLYYCCTC